MAIISFVFRVLSIGGADTAIPFKILAFRKWEMCIRDSTDGQPGIFNPNSMEMNAVREVATNMGGSLGSSINISTNAGAQLASRTAFISIEFGMKIDVYKRQL